MLATQLVGEILVDVLLVRPRQDHSRMPTRRAGQHLLLDPTDRQHAAARA
jgi:hypothetical protein